MVWVKAKVRGSTLRKLSSSSFFSTRSCASVLGGGGGGSGASDLRPMAYMRAPKREVDGAGAGVGCI